ncbi:TrbI/VirB10 family protein [Hirschia baltica]|uniref:Conjugation TrbI family protein n=1 Tax=Hirschia baltica (strain ATCC 49814 / DSM 5838 / IFAM 1418) TaxID=582402 RepID=C6XNV6_HIRBI|nr:TrbI/VirB10 family protein [Hirschia baltica]ACT58359.1 conjugation TrbI family protein [Hirschia baltica ATCC 49814]
MSDPIPFSEHADKLNIRSKPRPVTRINRKVLIVGAGIGVMGLFAAANIALAPPKAVDPSQRRELYNTTNTRKPDGLARLPKTYNDVPKLGPPLNGDLGATILAAERDLGIEPTYLTNNPHSFKPNPLDEAERAARMRQAKLAEAASQAPVFFQLQSRSGVTSSATPALSAQHQAMLETRSELMALAKSSMPQTGSGFGGQHDSNLQDKKLAFANEHTRSDIYNPHRLETPASPYQIMAGSLIPASLVTGINSDLPGAIIAQVTQPVYDTASGHHILIPQGARLLGRYQSNVSFGQNRALVTWNRILFPDGRSIIISAPGADSQGFAGLSDKTDHHWDRVFAAAGLATLLNIGSELGSNDDSDIVRAIRNGTSDTINQAGQAIVDKQLGIQPTIKVRPGWPLRVIVTRDLILEPTQ